MHIHNIQWREEDCTFSRQTKYIKGELKKSGTTFLTQQPDGGMLETTEKKHWRRL